jgi:hypothetical protein
VLGKGALGYPEIRSISSLKVPQQEGYSFVVATKTLTATATVAKQILPIYLPAVRLSEDNVGP